MFLEFKSALFGRQVLHKSLMSSYDVRLLHCRHSIGHNSFITAPEVRLFALKVHLLIKYPNDLMDF
jgi:hypothetical protein